MVTGDHDWCNSGGAALVYRVGHLGTGWIDQRDQSQKCEFGLHPLRGQLFGRIGPVPKGEGEHAVSFPRQTLGFVQDGMAVQRTAARAGKGVATLGQDLLGGALRIGDNGTVAAMQCRHALARCVEGDLVDARCSLFQCGFVEARITGRLEKRHFGGIASGDALGIGRGVVAQGHGAGEPRLRPRGLLGRR